MKCRWIYLAVAFLFVSTATAANDEPTTLAEVLRSARAYSPLVHAAAAQVREREADITRAQGAFDHRLEAGINSRLSGYYGGTAATATVTRPLKAMNAEAFASYRLGDGAFPVYDGGAVTGTLGEARIGVALSLLRDREIDDRRYALARAEVEAQSQRHAFRAQLVSLQQQAYVAYTRWLIAQRLLETYRELLAVAEQRGQALQRRVDRGDVAAFLLAENEQAILQRKALVVDATRQAGVAAETLSLYLRDADGRTRRPVYDPALAMPADDLDLLMLPLRELLERAFTRRPDIAIADLAREVATLERDLAQNEALPRLDLSLYASRDFGQRAAALRATDSVADLRLSVPLERRQARGREAAAAARIEGLSERIRFLYEQAEVDLEVALLNVRATRDLEQVARQEYAAAQSLAVAEGRRFEAGLSDFFLLNQRERSIAEAALKRWQAHLDHQIALAGFHAASMNLEALGLGDDPALPPTPGGAT